MRPRSDMVRDRTARIQAQVSAQGRTREQMQSSDRNAAMQAGREERGNVVNKLETRK